ncbi:F-box only protein 41 [Holothuria leucospilota]|uniref:F-box only protein 41 n=1 Tax=Holothuria leucospilota TaxID=206669 RepID=A0A9Q1BH56_HOLLE|nr:F-box only protein 41 [Holothuria leucospilota]
MNCPVCKIKLSSQGALRTHLTFDHTHQQLQEVAEYGKSYPLSSFQHLDSKFGFSSEAQELFSQLHNARQLHNQNLLSQRRALNTLSKSLEPGLSLLGNAGIEGKDVKKSAESWFKPYDGPKQHEVSNRVLSGATSAECWRHQSEIRRLEASLLEKKQEIAHLVLQLKKEMEELENKDMIITDLNTFLQETAEKQSVARAKLEAYMDSLLTRTAVAEEEVKSMRSLSPSLLSQKQYGNKSSDPRDNGFSGDGLVRTYSVPASLRKSSIMRERLYTTKRNSSLQLEYKDQTSANQLRRSLYSVGSPSAELERVLDQLKTKQSLTGRTSLPASNQKSMKEPFSGGSGRRCRSLSPGNEWRGMAQTVAKEEYPFHVASYQETTETETSPFLYPGTIQSTTLKDTSTQNRFKNHRWTHSSQRVKNQLLQQRVQDEISQADIERSLYRRQLQKRMAEEEASKTYPSRNHNLWVTSTDTISSLGETDSTRSLSVSSLSDIPVQNENWFSSEYHNMDIYPVAHRHVVLRCVMEYLDIDSLLNCALVCKEWKHVSRHPSLWRCLHFVSRRVSSKFLETISSWCTELQVLKLSKLRSSSKRMKGETKEAHQKRISGRLDEGLEILLCSSQGNLMVVKITDCPFIFSKRSLMMIGRYCPNLRSLKVSGVSYAINKEIIKSLAEGCPNITSLQILPGSPAKGKSQTFSNSCLSVIGQTWYHLQALSIGGKAFSKSGLAAIAECCQQLQVLELSKAHKIEESIAKQMCRVGLKDLHTLFFTHTVVTPQALLQFHASCPHLKCVRVYLSMADVFPSQKKNYQTKNKFDDVISRLEKLKEHRGLRDVLYVSVSNR